MTHEAIHIRTHNMSSHNTLRVYLLTELFFLLSFIHVCELLFYQPKKEGRKKNEMNLHYSDGIIYTISSKKSTNLLAYAIHSVFINIAHNNTHYVVLLKNISFHII